MNHNDKGWEETETTKPAFAPSPYQQAVVDWVANDAGNASVIAVAGAGKTTTLRAAACAIDPGATAYAVVFNRKNADELRSSFPPNVLCGTFHSIWMKACRDNLGRGITVDSNKTSIALMQVLPTMGIRDSATGLEKTVLTPTAREYAAPVRSLVAHAKNAGVGLLQRDEPATYATLADMYDVDLTNLREADVFAYASNVLAKSCEMSESVIDFDDMLYLPLIHGWGVSKRDFVFVDEAQDSNSVQRALVERMVKPGGRIVFVGDPHQAIYGFRGATSNAMSVIAEQFDTVELPLTVSFRCPKAVVAYARRYVSHIESHDDAPEGAVHAVATLSQTALLPGSAVVCRTSAPLVELAYAMIGKRIPVRILGRDIGVGLRTLIERMKAKSLDDLSGRLTVYAEREIARAQSKKDDAKVQSISDKVASINEMIAAQGPDGTIATLLRDIDTLFSNTLDHACVTLSTVHKAKGLEWPRVFIIRPDLMPLPWVKKPWQQEQEKNIAYVACTRAKRELYIVDGEHVAIVA